MAKAEVKEVKKTKDNKKKNTTKKVVKKESYFKSLKKEISLVKWPTFKEVVKYSVSTIIFCVFICLFFLLLVNIMSFIVGGIN